MSETDQDIAPDRARTGWPLWVKLLLGGSLALNLLFVGAALGIWWRVGSHPGHDLAGPRGASALIFALDKDDRRSFWKAVRSARGEDRATRSDPGVVLAMLRAEPLDVAGLEAAIASDASRRHARQAQMQALWLDRITAMSSQERARYADRLEQMWDRRGKARQ